MVTLKASHIVKPAEPTPEEFMYLSEIDQINPLTNVPTVYYYRPTTNISLEEAGRILRDSLSKALVRFYPLAGRLRWTNGGRVELHCNSMGVLVVEAESELKMDDLGGFLTSPEVKSLIPSVDLEATPLHQVPVAVVQVTKFSCGGIALGTGFSHILADGQSAGHFIAEWAKIARGEESDDHPFLDRRVLQQDEHQLLAVPSLKLSDFITLPNLIGQPDNLGERQKETRATALKVSEEQIEALRSKANKDLDDNLKNKCSFSRFEATCAHIWKCLSMARGLKPQQETVLFLRANIRNRIKPPLPKRYFGNAVMTIPISSTVDEVLSNPLSYVARKIKTGIENVTDEYVRTYLKSIDNTPDISNMRYFHSVGCNKGSFFGNPNLMINTWIRVPVFGAQFGWGDEFFMGPAALGYDGKFLLIPGEKGDDSFLLPLRLQKEHVDAFTKYFYEEI